MVAALGLAAARPTRGRQRLRRSGTIMRSGSAGRQGFREREERDFTRPALRPGRRASPTDPCGCRLLPQGLVVPRAHPSLPVVSQGLPLLPHGPLGNLPVIPGSGSSSPLYRRRPSSGPRHLSVSPPSPGGSSPPTLSLLPPLCSPRNRARRLV